MDGRTVVVTGGTRGIGAASVRAFADAGAHVVTCARDTGALDELAGEIRESGGTITTQRADVRDEFDVERLVETAAHEGGAIDVLVANAGVYHGDPGETPVDRESYAAFDDTMRTNARGVFTTAREARPHLADEARLLVLSGGVAREARAGFGAYAVSKAAAEAVARQFAVDTEWPVGVVDPGAVATDLTGGRGTDPERAADLLLWAARDAAPERLDGSVLDRRAMREA
ncbi:SDR family NAD(P)-dependent oxidoreductase [Halosimplex salinum]|uniref:SDR family NAD(P)-dependent oxidoreductase n=1 Tax=Halosimplex salinum TaxID=1710538 RepID=UPI000F490569|nr:SDR family oxidoreductase [Halosimplex salinum]